MKKFLGLLIVLGFISSMYANSHTLVWKMSELPFQPLETGSEQGIVKAGFDTDQDGYGEFLTAYTDMDSNYLLMYEATGDNTYDLVWSFRYPVAANTYAGIAVGDLDNNGIVEIITTMPAVADDATPNPPRLWVFEWSNVKGENKYGDYSTGSLVPTTEWNFDMPDQTDFRPYSLIIEDMDNDGKNELVTGVRSGGRGGEVMVISVEGEFTGFPSWVIEYNLQGLSGGSMYNATTGDLDNDGKKEIYAMVWNEFKLYFIENTAPDQYELVDSLINLTQAQGIDEGALESIRVTDVNNDGINELYIAGTEPGNTMYVITNITDVSKITAADVKVFYHFPKQSGGKLRTMWVADPDQDGLTDLMIGGEMNGQIFDLEYNGSGDPADSNSWTHSVAFDIFEYSGFAPTDSSTISPRLFYGCPANDMDRDGLNEYVFVNYSTDFNIWKGDAYVWILEADKAAPTGNVSLEVATEVQFNGATAKGLVFKQGRYLKDGQTIWFCGVNPTTKKTYAFVSADGGTTFTQSAEVEGRAAMMDAFDDKIALIATAEGKIWKTDDGGINWYEAYMYTDPGWFDGIRVINDSVVVAYGDGTSSVPLHLIRSEDKGDMWDEVQGVDFEGAYEGMYTYGTQMVNLGESIWISATDYVHGFIIRSYDGGLNWETFVIAECGDRFYSIAFSDQQNGMGLGSGNICVATTDGGTTWSIVETPANFDVYGFSHITGTQAIMIAGSKMLADSSMSSAAYYTLDLGTTWTEITVPASADEKDIELLGGIFKNASTGYVFSYNGQVYKINGNFPVDVDESEIIIIARDKWLQQNYPNPFNPSTTIRFNLPATGQVKLVIYDALGRRMETLVDQILQAGPHEFQFSAQKYPSGMYFYTLQTGTKTESRKMVLLK